MDPHSEPEGSPSAGPTPAPGPQASDQAQPPGGYAAFRERFDALIPAIQRQWPEVARHTLEATRGSLDEVVALIASRTGRAATLVRGQLLDLLHVAEERTQRLAHELEPLEDRLERLLDELDTTLRPRIEKPVRERPLLALGIAAGVGLLVGLLLGSARRSA